MAAKKNLTGAINRGVDRLFSVNDANDAQDTHEVSEAGQAAQAAEQAQAAEAVQPRRAQDVDPAALASTIKDMEAAIEADAERKRAAAEARRTQGRKGFAMPRLNISLTPSGFEYVQVMARISGKSVTRYISDLVDRDAEKNAERYRKARELLADE